MQTEWATKSYIGNNSNVLHRAENRHINLFCVPSHTSNKLYVKNTSLSYAKKQYVYTQKQDNTLLRDLCPFLFRVWFNLS